jgi:hypothetical protein
MLCHLLQGGFKGFSCLSDVLVPVKIHLPQSHIPEVILCNYHEGEHIAMLGWQLMEILTL